MTGGNPGSKTGNAAVLNLEPGVLQDTGFTLGGALHAEDALRLDSCKDAYVIDKTHSLKMLLTFL